MPDYMFIYLDEDFSKDTKRGRKKSDFDEDELQIKSILVSEDLNNIEGIFMEALIKEKDLMIYIDSYKTTPDEIEKQNILLQQIKSIPPKELQDVFKKLNNKISTIHTLRQNIVIAKKYLILYYFATGVYKRTVVKKLRKLGISLKKR